MRNRDYDYEIHDAAELLPFDKGSLADLVDDINKRGQQDAIELLPEIVDGRKVLIDGRRRLEACKQLGIRPRTTEVWTDDPVGYVLSRNVHRRHLTASQIAVIRARACEYCDRQKRSPNPKPTHNVERAIKTMDGQISRTTARLGERLCEAAPSEVVDAIKQGKTSVGKAAADMGLKKPAVRQSDIIQQVQEAVILLHRARKTKDWLCVSEAILVLLGIAKPQVDIQ